MDPVNDTAFSSFDDKHIDNVLNDVARVLETHPFFKTFEADIKRNPYRITFEQGWKLEAVNMNLQGSDPGCFDKETEILTNDGWKLFKNLKYTDKVLSLNPENSVADYYPIKKIIAAPYKGILKKLKSRTSEFLLTPDHNLLTVKNYKKGVLELKSLSSVRLSKQIYSPAIFKWKGLDPKTITFEGYSNSKKISFKIDTVAWVKLVAWYLSEGTLDFRKGHYRLKISQKNNCESLENVFRDVGLKFNKKYKKENEIYCYVVNNKFIVSHLREFFGEKKEKHIASYFKKFSARLLNIFINEYLLGDGHSRIRKNKYSEKSVFTCLRNLADDLQELAQKAGYKTNLRSSTQDVKFNGYSYRKTIYFVSLCRSKYTVFEKSLITDVDYNDYVYCVDTEPFHTIFVRRNGHVIWTGNSAWFGKHVKRMWIEEFSAESEKVEEKRHDAVSEMGCVYKFSGMTNFTKYKPAGKIYYDLDKRPFLVNLSSMTNPTWNARKKVEKIKEYGGEESINYKIYVLGEVIEDGLSAIDIDRVRENYSKDKQIKHIEITKDKFPIFQHFLICERPKQCDALYIAGDIGENITEIIVVSEYEKKFKYLYNITLHNLIDKEQYRIFKFLGELLKANCIALDTTDGQGRSIYHSLQEDFPKENLCSVAFNEKIAVDFLKNEEGVVQFEDGKPLYREEWIMEWAMKRLRDIFYEFGRIEIPWDTNLDIQLNSVIATYSKLGNRVLYKCCHTEDHLYAAWLVWFISQWINEFMNVKPITKKTFSKFGA